MVDELDDDEMDDDDWDDDDEPRMEQVSKGVDPRRCVYPALGGAVVGIVLAIVLPVPAWAYFLIIPGGAALGAATAGIVWAVRAGSADRHYELSLDDPPGNVALGQTFGWGMTVTPKEEIELGEGRVVLRCQEHTIALPRADDPATHRLETLHEETYPITEGRPLAPPEAAELRAEVVVPEGGLPSYEGDYTSIEWTLVVDVGVTGSGPDVYAEGPVTVLPELAGEDGLGPDGGLRVPALWEEPAPEWEGNPEHGGVRGELAIQGAPILKHVPAVPAGATCRLDISAVSDSEIDCRGIECWVGCRIRGKGEGEQVDLWGEDMIHEGPLSAGQRVAHTVEVTIPGKGPVSFHGRLVKCDWMVRLRVDIPVWRDRHIELPFIVTPRLAARSAE